MIAKINRNKKGFTLVEIIVVLVVMGILLAIAVPSVMGYVTKAKEQRYIAEARNGYLGAQTYLIREVASGNTNNDQLQADIGMRTILNEIGSDTKVTSVSCVLKDLKIKNCDVSVEIDGVRSKVKFTANKLAEITLNK
ncbi:MAG: prepilin-type N-terminal cleavage/methylation domain-containing protein [Longicatena sp.]